MASSIIPDAKHQELNISFTFDQHYEDKAIINAMVDHTPYQLQFFFNPDSEFEDLKSALLGKQYRIVERSPQILKLKVAFVHFVFKNVEKITLDTLKQSIVELNQKIADLDKKVKQKSEKNAFFEESMKELRKQFDSMTTQMADMKRLNEENKEQMMRMIKSEQEKWELKMGEERLKGVGIEGNYSILKEKVETIERERLEQAEEAKNVRAEQERVSKQHEEKMNRLEEELVRTNETGTIKEEEIRSLYNGRLENLQERVEKEQTKRQQWERVKKEEDQSLKKTIFEKLNKMEEGKDMEELKPGLHNLQEMVKQLQSETLKNLKQEIMKQVQQERVRREAMEEQLKQLSQERLKQTIVETIKRLEEEERLKKEMEERERLIRIQQEEEQRKLKLIQEQQLKLEQERQKEIEYQQKVSCQNAQYLFSSTHKHSWIKLENNNTKASRFYLALVEGVVFEKGSSIRFRIQSISWFVAVGLGIRNVIAKNEYQIRNLDEIGHGCFLLWHGGRSYSHSNKEHNNVLTDFKYSEGDVILVSSNGDELCWMNENTKKEFRMKAKLTADEWSDACFCVFLNSASVQILK